AENAIPLVTRAMPCLDAGALDQAIDRAGARLAGFGVTSCMDAATGLLAGMAEIRAFQRAARTGRLRLRVRATLPGEPARSIVAQCHAEGLLAGTGCDMFRIGAVKLFLDGSAGAGTAWMRAPYANQPGNRGVPIYGDAELHALVRHYTGLGYPMACHAIGDAAIAQILRVCETLPAPPRFRHRIEHCGFADAAQSRRMAAAGVIPVPQPVFIRDFGDGYIPALGPMRADRAYPMRLWLDAGLSPPASTDAPVCDSAPLASLHAMLTRETISGRVLGPDQRLTAPEALRAYTEYGARAEGSEDAKGRLLPGMLADIAVFDRDLTGAAPADILNRTRCVMTVLDGRIIHDRLG
ncbi:MAG: amidohydrolase family protein, partial [Paracoccus sp. (in: a-proteobacteria)]|nr:amidohydrolase family protein [Paracoccus sp. (in: a-proteobacteria)]